MAWVLRSNSVDTYQEYFAGCLQKGDSTFNLSEKEMATHSSICLEDPMDRGAWWTAVYGVAQS